MGWVARTVALRVKGRRSGVLLLNGGQSSGRVIRRGVSGDEAERRTPEPLVGRSQGGSSIPRKPLGSSVRANFGTHGCEVRRQDVSRETLTGEVAGTGTPRLSGLAWKREWCDARHRASRIIRPRWPIWRCASDQDPTPQTCAPRRAAFLRCARFRRSPGPQTLAIGRRSPTGWTGAGDPSGSASLARAARSDRSRDAHRSDRRTATRSTMPRTGRTSDEAPPACVDRAVGSLVPRGRWTNLTHRLLSRDRATSRRCPSASTSGASTCGSSREFDATVRGDRMGDGYRRIGAGEHRRGSSAVRDDTETLERGHVSRETSRNPASVLDPRSQTGQDWPVTQRSLAGLISTVAWTPSVRERTVAA
jgi:hypothetical protein